MKKRGRVALGINEEGERGILGLWLSVLSQAINDLQRKRGDRNHSLWWFESEVEYLGSFVSICDFLNVCPHEVRRRILEEVNADDSAE